MSTELRAALHEAATQEPFDSSRLDDVLAAGARRARRRTAAVVGSCALAVVVVAVIVSVVAGGDGGRQEPTPARVVRLDVGEAPARQLDVLASVRTTWREPMNDPDHDRFLGLTTDGLALRSRLTGDGDLFQLGLTDPRTGATDWLPPPPGAVDTAVELTADRLVLFGRPHAYRATLLLFDRRASTWQSTELRLSHDLEVHIAPRLEIGPDGRLYLGRNFEREAGPWHWWSYDVEAGGAGRPEPELDGSQVAIVDGTQVRASSDGRVVVSAAGDEQLVGAERPVGCDPPADPDIAQFPPSVALAGTRPVVTFWCGGGPERLTVVYRTDRHDTVQVPGASVLAADGDDVLLTTAGERAGHVYLLDLARLELTRIAPGLHDEQVAVTGGLVLLNRPGPIEANDVYDVVWEVAGLPRAR